MGEAVKILATPMLRDQELLRYTACMLSVCLWNAKITSSISSPFVSSMFMTLPMSRVLEIWVNLFLAVDRDVDELRGGTAGGILMGGVAAGFWSPVSGRPVAPSFTSFDRGRLWRLPTSSAALVEPLGCVCVVCEGDNRRISRSRITDDRSAFLNTCWALKQPAA